MKKIILSLSALLLLTTAFGQKINYQPTFDGALAKAKADKKLLLVIINSSGPKFIPPPPGVGGAPKPFVSALGDPEVIDLYNKNFVTYTVMYNDTASAALRRKYQLANYPAYLFLDGRGNLVYKDNGAASRKDKYIDMSKKALATLASGKTLSSYEDRYKREAGDPAFLKEYITFRQSLGLTDNAKLIDEYAERIPVDAFKNYNEVFFILQAGPYAYSKTYSLCYANSINNRRIIDSIYKKEPVAIRSAINQRIIANTINEAINRKDVNLAQQAANYLAGTWSRSNPRQGAISSQSEMIYYYRMIKDTANYYRQASFYYDNFYMNIGADSAKKVDQKRLEALRKASLANFHPDTIRRVVKGPDSVKRTITTTTHLGQPVITSPGGSISAVASTLNNAAYEFYTMGTHNQTYLAKAMLWTKRAIELNPIFSYYDTLAHLLYRMGFYDEALSTQTKAVSLAEGSNLDNTEIEHLKDELNKIKTRKI